MTQTCPLCTPEDEIVLWQDNQCRVILVEQDEYPGYCRVIWGQHRPEMTDLSKPDRDHLMNVVYAVEAVLRHQLETDKINLAALGNQVPHLHWHVIPRRTDDPTFPDAIWAPAKRTAAFAQSVDPTAVARALSTALKLAL